MTADIQLSYQYYKEEERFSGRKSGTSRLLLTLHWWYLCQKESPSCKGVWEESLGFPVSTIERKQARRKIGKEYWISQPKISTTFALRIEFSTSCELGGSQSFVFPTFLIPVNLKAGSWLKNVFNWKCRPLFFFLSKGCMTQMVVSKM